MSDFRNLPKQEGYTISKIQVENDLSPDGAQILVTCHHDDPDVPKWFVMPLGTQIQDFLSSLLPSILTLQLLVEAFRDNVSVRITYQEPDQEQGSACQLVAVRLERD
jgi:hypothetical protein